eukprot:g7698.t1
MKTTFSVCTLCLVLCVAGSSAATVNRRLMQDQSSSPSSPTVVTSINIFEATRVDLTNILHKAINNSNAGIEPGSVSLKFAVEVGIAIARFIEHQVDPVRSRRPGVCVEGPDLDQGYTSSFIQQVQKAFRRSSNIYAKAANHCFKKAVGQVTRRKLRGVRYSTCTNEQGYLSKFMTEDDYKKGIANAFEPVISAIHREDEDAAKRCGASIDLEDEGTSDVVESG